MAEGTAKVTRCYICSEPVDCGKHQLAKTENGIPILFCPSFAEFVLDGDIVIIPPNHFPGQVRP